MKKTSFLLIAGLLGMPCMAAPAVNVRLNVISPAVSHAVSPENVIMLSDTPGYRIADAISNGFTVTRVASVAAEAAESSKISIELFISEISSRAAEAGANAIYITGANSYAAGNSIAEVKGDIYRIQWATDVPENLQAGFSASARLYNTEVITGMPYYTKRQALLFGVERDVIKSSFGLELPVDSSPLERFSEMTFGELSKKQRKMMEDFFKLQSPPSDDTSINDILIAGNIESLDVFLGGIKAGLKKQARSLMKENPQDYAVYREMYVRIYGAPPIEDDRSEAGAEY